VKKYIQQKSSYPDLVGDTKVVLIRGNPDKRVEINTENIIWGNIRIRGIWIRGLLLYQEVYHPFCVSKSIQKCL
jgi:hypothetical protein